METEVTINIRDDLSLSDLLAQIVTACNMLGKDEVTFSFPVRALGLPEVFSFTVRRSKGQE